MVGKEMKISVLLPVYNAESYLQEAIDSILSQSFTDFEFIIIDDGSTDNSENIILSYNDTRIKYVKNAENLKLIATLNKGLTLCRGKYIARMDSDDIALPDRLKVQYEFMEKNPDVGVCGANIEAFYQENGRKLKVWFPESDSEIRAYTYFQAAFCHPTVMLRKSVLEENNLNYPKDYYRAEDYALWVEMLRYTKAYNIQSTQLKYRKHNSSETWYLSAGTASQPSVVNHVQAKYFKEKGIEMSIEKIAILGGFANRSTYFPIAKKNQLEIAESIEHFLSQLRQKDAESYSIAREFISTACCYRFIKSCKLPSVTGLMRLFLTGLWIFSKKMPIFVMRKLIK
jgi:glycosyltransferase involved in cell wall biosynthesis